MAAYSTCNCTIQVDLGLKTIGRYISADVIYTVPDFVRELYRGCNVSIGDLEIPMIFVSSRWIPGFEVLTQNEFFVEVIEDGQREKKEKKYIQQIFMGPWFGPIKQLRYSVVMINRSEGSE